jgi:hypothetical protein
LAAAAHHAEFVAGHDRRGGIGGEVAKERRSERADATQSAEAEQEGGAVLYEAGTEQERHDGADDSLDQAESALAQQRSEHRLGKRRLR